MDLQFNKSIGRLVAFVAQAALSTLILGGSIYLDYKVKYNGTADILTRFVLFTASWSAIQAIIWSFDVNFVLHGRDSLKRGRIVNMIFILITVAAWLAAIACLGTALSDYKSQIGEAGYQVGQACIGLAGLQLLLSLWMIILAARDLWFRHRENYPEQVKSVEIEAA